MLTVRDAATYPFGVPRYSFVVADGAHRSLSDSTATEARRLDDLMARPSVRQAWESIALADPVALLTCGSNASPTRMLEKLGLAPIGKALALRIRCRGWTPVYSATVAYYGAVPATFLDEAAVSEPFLMLIDRRDFETILRTETRTANYDAVSLSEPQRLAANLPVDLEIAAFVSRFGPLIIDGEAQRLAEFQPNVAAGVTQAQVLSKLLSAFEPGLSVATYAEQASHDSTLIDRFRAFVRLEFGPRP